MLLVVVVGGDGGDNVRERAVQGDQEVPSYREQSVECQVAGGARRSREDPENLGVPGMFGRERDRKRGREERKKERERERVR